MSLLINQLKDDHKQIATLLNEVNQLGISSQKGQEKLISAKNLLIAHLQREDKELYPVLHKLALGNNELKSNIAVFAKDMKAITDVALQFFSKYEKGGSGVDFGREYGKLFSALTQRITKEENVLYSEYEKSILH